MWLHYVLFVIDVIRENFKGELGLLIQTCEFWLLLQYGSCRVCLSLTPSGWAHLYQRHQNRETSPLKKVEPDLFKLSMKTKLIAKPVSPVVLVHSPWGQGRRGAGARNAPKSEGRPWRPLTPGALPFSKVKRPRETCFSLPEGQSHGVEARSHSQSSHSLCDPGPVTSPLWARFHSCEMRITPPYCGNSGCLHFSGLQNH